MAFKPTIQEGKDKRQQRPRKRMLYKMDDGRVADEGFKKDRL